VSSITARRRNSKAINFEGRDGIASQSYQNARSSFLGGQENKRQGADIDEYDNELDEKIDFIRAQRSERR
jgi:hypothetical protein